MIKLEEWVDIVSLHRQGMSIKAISRRLGISRNAVRRAIRRGGPPKYTRPRRPSRLDPYKDYLLRRLSEFPELSCAALFDEIRAMGYEGGMTILKDFTRPYRIRRKEPVVRFETPPGRQAQVDWAHLGTHMIEGKPTALYLFVMVLGFSRAIYAEAATSKGLEAFIEAHKRAFFFFGGIPEEILYDNMKQVVLERRACGNHRFNPAFLDFAGRYGFSPKLCRPYRAKTKGKVERAIGYLKDRFFLGRTFQSVEDLNFQLTQWISCTANRRVHATTKERPADRLTKENLAPLPLVEPKEVPLPPVRRKGAVLFCFEAPEVEVRDLSVYEEACK